jgi:hypothetical protein
VKNLILTLGLASTLLIAACGKKDEAAAPAAADAVAPVAAPATDAAAPAAAAATTEAAKAEAEQPKQ